MAKSKKQTQETPDDMSKELKTLLANFEMLERTKAEVELRGSEEQVNRIKISEEEVIEKIRMIDPQKAIELEKPKKKSDVENILGNNEFGKDISVEDILKKEEKTTKKGSNLLVKDDVIENDVFKITNTEKAREVEKKSENNIDRSVAYDVIPLPSHGECYKEKLERIPVGYLTAYDENFITSPNLYQDGLVIEFLLKHKILNKDINIDELCTGDIDAITLFLRATSYGVEFPITVKDPVTKEEIETVVDLSQFKAKPFNLKGDKDGYFDFTLPVSKDVVKFRFLTRGDEKTLKTLAKLENNGVKALTIKKNLETLIQGIQTDNILSGKDKQYAINNLKELEVWVKKLEEEKGLMFSRMITNRLEVSVMAVNGNYDKEYISKYVRNMCAMDSLKLRQYIMENEPGINFEFEVERPESLGGGSFKSFLEWDDTVFLNFA